MKIRHRSHLPEAQRVDLPPLEDKALVQYGLLHALKTFGIVVAVMLSLYLIMVGLFPDSGVTNEVQLALVSHELWIFILIGVGAQAVDGSQAAVVAVGGFVQPVRHAEGAAVEPALQRAGRGLGLHRLCRAFGLALRRVDPDDPHAGIAHLERVAIDHAVIAAAAPAAGEAPFDHLRLARQEAGGGKGAGEREDIGQRGQRDQQQRRAHRGPSLAPGRLPPLEARRPDLAPASASWPFRFEARDLTHGARG